MWHRHFKYFEAGRTGDLGKFHVGHSYGSRFSQPSASLYCSALDGLAQHAGPGNQLCMPMKNDTRVSFSGKATLHGPLGRTFRTGCRCLSVPAGSRETKFAVVSGLWHADRLKIRPLTPSKRPNGRHTDHSGSRLASNT
jgi:hypothetical protein